MGREALPKGWDALSVGQEGSEGPSNGPVVVGSPSQQAGMGQDLSEGRKGLGGTSGGLGVVGRPYWRVRRPFQWAGSGR